MPRVLPSVSILLGILIVTALIVSPGPIALAQDAAQGASPKILRIPYDQFPDTLDPHLSDKGQWSVSGLDYEGLTRLDEEMNLVPAAAESWTFSPDGLTLTFHLRDGLVYSDGSPLTA